MFKCSITCSFLFNSSHITTTHKWTGRGEWAACQEGCLEATGSARVSGVDIVLLRCVQWQLRVTRCFKVLQTTHTYNPAGRAYGRARWRDRGLRQASVLWGTTKKWKREWESAHSKEITQQLFFTSNSGSPSVSSLPSPPACIMGATPRILKMSETRRESSWAPTCHAFICMSMCST